MISVDEALQHYRDSITPLPVQTVAIADALHCVLALAPRTAIDLPPFAQSAVDGYALRTIDLEGATSANPVHLPIAADVAAGVHEVLPALPNRQCLRVMTGAPLPSACDAVVMQENVRREAGHIVVSAPIAPGRGLNKRAEEMPCGTPLGRAGQRITAGLQGALARAGVSHVKVRRPPTISVLITGDEIVPVGAASRALRPGESRDGNGLLIASWLREQGCAAPALSYVRDDPRAVAAALDHALDTSDLVITNGGTSVGDRDYIRSAAQRLGATPVFWRVAQKPGKPLYFARRGRTLLLGLPGNPGAVVAGLALHARCVLDCLQGVATPGPTLWPGRLTQALTVDAKRERLVRASHALTADGVRLTPLPGQAAHMLGNMASATALLRVPPGDRPLPVGAQLQWLAL